MKPEHEHGHPWATSPHTHTLLHGIDLYVPRLTSELRVKDGAEKKHKFDEKEKEGSTGRDSGKSRGNGGRAGSTIRLGASIFDD